MRGDQAIHYRCEREGGRVDLFRKGRRSEGQRGHVQGTGGGEGGRRGRLGRVRLPAVRCFAAQLLPPRQGGPPQGRRRLVRRLQRNVRRLPLRGHTLRDRSAAVPSGVRPGGPPHPDRAHQADAIESRHRDRSVLRHLSPRTGTAGVRGEHLRGLSDDSVRGYEQRRDGIADHGDGTVRGTGPIVALSHGLDVLVPSTVRGENESARIPRPHRVRLSRHVIVDPPVGRGGGLPIRPGSLHGGTDRRAGPVHSGCRRGVHGRAVARGHGIRHRLFGVIRQDLESENDLRRGRAVPEGDGPRPGRRAHHGRDVLRRGGTIAGVAIGQPPAMGEDRHLDRRERLPDRIDRFVHRGRGGAVHHTPPGVQGVVPSLRVVPVLHHTECPVRPRRGKMDQLLGPFHVPDPRRRRTHTGHR
mmetsp:Transcript_28117/g.82750  ORF Transcript_28117/g.82750 Transcript_28117/m.82750 type:complete len:413 (+) Transcript_28117:602-1840(+)